MIIQKCLSGSRANMGTGKNSTLIALLAILTVAAAAEDVTETGKQSAPAKDLLSTLQDLRHSLTDQIAALKSSSSASTSPADDRSERSHLVQHYTAQKNNIEHEISLIQSLERTPASDPAPRHILTSLGAEEKIVPSLINIFKKTPKPSHDAPSHDYGYSFPPSYPSYHYPGYPGYPGYPAYPGYGPQFPYPYQGVPPHPPLKPGHLNMDSLVQSTFAGYEANNNNSQVFLTDTGGPLGAARPAPPPPPQSSTSEQVNLRGEVPPTTVTTQTQPASSQTPPLPPTPPQSGMGVFVYYPNAVITEDDDPEPEERPSIVDRVGQAFDRFGQVITNLASLRSASGSDGVLPHSPAATRLRVHQNRPRSSSTVMVAKARRIDEGEARRIDEGEARRIAEGEATRAIKFGDRQRRRRPISTEKVVQEKATKIQSQLGTDEKAPLVQRGRKFEERRSQLVADENSSPEQMFAENSSPLVEKRPKYRWVAV